MNSSDPAVPESITLDTKAPPFAVISCGLDKVICGASFSELVGLAGLDMSELERILPKIAAVLDDSGIRKKNVGVLLSYLPLYPTSAWLAQTGQIAPVEMFGVTATDFINVNPHMVEPRSQMVVAAVADAKNKSGADRVKTAFRATISVHIAHEFIHVMGVSPSNMRSRSLSLEEIEVLTDAIALVITSPMYGTAALLATTYLTDSLGQEHVTDQVLVEAMRMATGLCNKHGVRVE